MNYFIKRGDKEYGPYTLADLQLYVQQGNISRDDLARSEGLDSWIPVGKVIGTIAAAAPPATGFGSINPANTAPLSAPPNLHWAVVLLLAICTLGLFAVIWMFVQAFWIRKVQPETKSLYYLFGYLVCGFGAGFIAALASRSIAPLLQLVAVVLWVMGEFAMRSDIEEYYSRERINLDLSGVMTFLFAPYYFQYHFNQMNSARRAQAATA